jgi:hypothetical protein
VIIAEGGHGSAIYQVHQDTGGFNAMDPHRGGIALKPARVFAGTCIREMIQCNIKGSHMHDMQDTPQIVFLARQLTKTYHMGEVGVAAFLLHVVLTRVVSMQLLHVV